MFSWKLILALSMSYTATHPASVPVEYLPAGSPPITIQAVGGNPTDDFAQAGRVLGDTYNDTLECRITLNTNSEVFRQSDNPKQRNSMVKHLRDGTIRNEVQKLFFIAHEVGHCFDNESVPTDNLNENGYRVWKEGYADIFAILVLKQLGSPASQLNTLAVFRENQILGTYGKQWGAMLTQAANTDVVGKSDKNLLAIAFEIRRNVWKST